MSDEVPSITVGDVDELDDPFLLDVRELEEYTAGHAPDSVLMPLGTVTASWSSLPRDRAILCICRSGARSAQATAFLVEQGLDVVNLEGGMRAWAAFGLDIVTADGGPGQVV
ncbi:MAG: rhodanese-like domain-containing protein [Acidimicrobiia bacterium]